MRKVKKLISGIICLSLLLLTVSTAFAAATPYYVTRPCTECANGNVRLYQRTEYEPKESYVHCGHTDTDQTYYVIQYESCDSCTYRHEVDRQEYLIHDCPWDQ